MVSSSTLPYRGNGTGVRRYNHEGILICVLYGLSGLSVLLSVLVVLLRERVLARARHRA
jgi:hypothetical protein